MTVSPSRKLPFTIPFEFIIPRPKELKTMTRGGHSKKANSSEQKQERNNSKMCTGIERRTRGEPNYTVYERKMRNRE